jgi:prepilin-type N-terminal cleavage/methylation domain-containing protein
LLTSRGSRGFNLIELVVVMVLAVGIAVALFSMILKSAESKKTYRENFTHAEAVTEEAYPQSRLSWVAGGRTEAGEYDVQVNFGDFVKTCRLDIGSDVIKSCQGGLPE